MEKCLKEISGEILESFVNTSRNNSLEKLLVHSSVEFLRDPLNSQINLSRRNFGGILEEVFRQFLGIISGEFLG